MDFFFLAAGNNDLNFNKLLKTTGATAKGHLDQERQGLQSTNIPSDLDLDHFPPQEPIKTYHIATAIEHFNPKTTAFSDLRGRFPHTSSRGNQYLLVIYDYDSNAILAAPLKNRQAGEITKA